MAAAKRMSERTRCKNTTSPTKELARMRAHVASKRPPRRMASAPSLLCGSVRVVVALALRMIGLTAWRPPRRRSVPSLAPHGPTRDERPAPRPSRPLRSPLPGGRRGPRGGARWEQVGAEHGAPAGEPYPELDGQLTTEPPLAVSTQRQHVLAYGRPFGWSVGRPPTLTPGRGITIPWRRRRPIHGARSGVV